MIMAVVSTHHHSDKEDSTGMGLSNIETRVKSVDGVFILESTPGKGTSALIKMIENLNQNVFNGKNQNNYCR